jgi:Methyltransferase domain
MSPPLLFTLRLAARRPRVFADYVRLSAASRRMAPEPPPWAGAADVLPVAEGLARLAELLGPAAPGPAHDRLGDVAREGAARAAPGREAMAGDAALGEIAYAVVRALRPAAVVETGVATGVATAFILAALADNGAGELHSVDLPPIAWVPEGRVGAAVPAALKDRWHYHWGSSRRLLAPVLETTRDARPRVFLHDSDHSYENMRWELESAWAALAPGDVLLCDDAHFHAGFADAAAALGGTPLWIAQPGQGGVTGVLVRR